MKIGLIDIDNKIPNLPLMKIKSFYKNNCDWYDGFSEYEKVFISKTFNFSKDYEYIIKANEIIKGGTGFNVKSRLADEIDICQPDYSIYPDCDFTLQRYTTGCIRNCEYCIVREKEGVLKDVDPMNENIKGKYIYLLDNNFFASKNWKANIKHLQAYNQKVKFEGVDIKILDDEMIFELSKVKLYKQLHIAWDNLKDNLIEKLKNLTSKIKSYKIMCYVLIGFNSTEEEDYYRVMKLKELGISPFVMPYNKKDGYQKQFARWVNHKAVFKTVEWKNYLKK